MKKAIEYFTDALLKTETVQIELLKKERAAQLRQTNFFGNIQRTFAIVLELALKKKIKKRLEK